MLVPKSPTVWPAMDKEQFLFGVFQPGYLHLAYFIGFDVGRPGGHQPHFIWKGDNTQQEHHGDAEGHEIKNEEKEAAARRFFVWLCHVFN